MLAWEVEVYVLPGCDRDSIHCCGSETPVFQRLQNLVFQSVAQRFQYLRTCNISFFVNGDFDDYISCDAGRYV